MVRNYIRRSLETALISHKIVLLSRRSAPGSDPLDEPSSLSGTLRSNSRDQSPERSDGTFLNCFRVLRQSLLSGAPLAYNNNHGRPGDPADTVELDPSDASRRSVPALDRTQPGGAVAPLAEERRNPFPLMLSGLEGEFGNAYSNCTAVEMITVALETEELLSSHKRRGQSFTQVHSKPHKTGCGGHPR